MFIGTWWSLMPPIIAILLALLTKEVYLSLFAGCALGALLVAEFHPWLAFDTLFNTMINSVDFSILMFMILLGMVVMLMQESGGRGTDPMQSSECPYNTRYANSPNAIQDTDYSIQVGIQYYADCLKEAGCTSPQDMDKLKLSLQGYNYGNGYITWAIRKYGGYSAENALQFSNEQAASHGWSAYGDPEYVPHVLRYYSSGGLFAGLFGGNGQIVSVALTQLGNEGGQKFWSWYGFDSHVAWCACFASWCGDQAGLIESGKMPKFSLCDDGIAWFQSKEKWKSRGYSPAPGTLIFFDWNGDGTSDHVGIVEKTEGSTVYTVEGNSSNAVRSHRMKFCVQRGLGALPSTSKRRGKSRRDFLLCGPVCINTGIACLFSPKLKRTSERIVKFHSLAQFISNISDNSVSSFTVSWV